MIRLDLRTTDTLALMYTVGWFTMGSYMDVRRRELHRLRLDQRRQWPCSGPLSRPCLMCLDVRRRSLFGRVQ